MRTRYKIRKRQKTTILVDHQDAAFGRVHPTKTIYEIEDYAQPSTVVATRSSFAGAENWVKRNGGIVIEVFI